MDTRDNGEDYMIWIQKQLPGEWYKKPDHKESKSLIRHVRQVHLKKKKREDYLKKKILIKFGTIGLSDHWYPRNRGPYCKSEKTPKLIMLKFDDSVPMANTGKDNVIADGIFTCHVEFKTFKHSGRQSVRQISVLKQITSEDHLLNGGSQTPSIVPEVEMSREQLWRLILPSGVNSGKEAI